VREYLIEVPHSPEECLQAGVGRTFAGTTYVGCGAGTHTTWIIAQFAAESEAWSLVPRLLLDTARVVRVNRIPAAAPHLNRKDRT
jgi:hypothetical protein